MVCGGDGGGGGGGGHAGMSIFELELAEASLGGGVDWGCGTELEELAAGLELGWFAGSFGCASETEREGLDGSAGGSEMQVGTYFLCE